MILAPENCGCPLKDDYISIVNSSVCPGMIMFMMLIESYFKGRCAIATPCSRVDPVDEVDWVYDFIVVGAGAAGSVVAGRLSEDPNNKVLLLEAGPTDPIGSRIPGLYKVFWGNEQVDWKFRTEYNPDYCRDQEDLGCNWPRGKVLGGSNMFNGAMYHRGHPKDYRDWVNAGAIGWSWEENLPYFDRTEGNKQIGELVSEEYHSATGPLPVERYPYQPPIGYDILRAMNSSGLPVITDLNDLNTPAGFTFAQTMSLRGQRYTTARAFLKPTSERPNFNLELNAYVTRVLTKTYENGEVRATGVEYIDKNGNTKIVHVRKEVILSAGAVKTPHILMLSGIGPKQTLENHNIPVVADLPVGQNLVNHYGVVFDFVLNKVENIELLNWNVSTEYLLEQRGPLSATGLAQLTGLLYSSLAEEGQPDIQFFFDGFYPDCSQTGAIGSPMNCSEDRRSLGITAVNVLAQSRGYMTINSSNPLDNPLFYPGFLSHPDDMVRLKDGAAYVKIISESKLLKEKYGIELNQTAIAPCADSGDVWSDAWVDCIVRMHTDPQNHQAGTAAIGLVTDSTLQVYGVNGLRVADASSMPLQVTGNPQAAIMMVAERAAQFIKETWN